jgi:hypothetical protein
VKKTILLVCALGLAACGGSSGSDETANTTLGPVETVAAAADVPDSLAADPLEGLYSLLQITDQADKDCITSKIDPASLTQPAASIDPSWVKALLECQPPGLVTAATQQLQGRLPQATPDQLTCVSKGVLKVVAKADSADLSLLMNSISAVPADLLGDVVAATKDCGVPEADLQAALAGGIAG